MGTAAAPADSDVAVKELVKEPVEAGAVQQAAGAGVRSELLAKPLSDDNALGQLGNYLRKVGHHICLDADDARVWIAKKLRGEGSDDEDALGEVDADADADAATGSAGDAVAVPRKKKILILMSDTGAGWGLRARCRLQPGCGGGL
jgi:hypothetical protein